MSREQRHRENVVVNGKGQGAGIVSLAVLCIPVLLWVWAGEAGAIIAIRPDLEVEGYVQAQTILRTPNFA
ncbi:MAG: hypothetical protein AB7G75_34820, partial [Candidatus Binatia bacterium]